jgi:hypothetical protein
MMDASQLRKLAGLTEAVDKLPLGLTFTLVDRANALKAVEAIIESGLAVDLSYSMGKYFFTFPSPEAADAAHDLTLKVIDIKKEQ